MDFLKINWIVIFITLVFLFIFIGLERKHEFVSDKIGIHPFRLYLIILFMGGLSSAMNYVAVMVFGSWQLMAITLVATVVIFTILTSIIRRKIRRRRDEKELERLRKEKEEMETQVIEEEVSEAQEEIPYEETPIIEEEPVDITIEDQKNEDE